MRRTGIMLAYPFEEKRLQKWEPPYIVQPKYDGVRCRAIIDENQVILLSSEENVIFSVPHINEALRHHFRRSIELDGELYCHGRSFEEIVSITSRSVNLHPNYREINYHIFDIISEELQVERTRTLSELTLDKPLIRTPIQVALSLDDILRALEFFTVYGYEGIIVRHLLNSYVRKRSTMMMKWKPSRSDTYLIVGGQEEVDKDGNPKNALGSFLVKDDDERTFSVGSGLTREQREEFWLNLPSLIGKRIVVNYQHTTDKGVPRFPVFVQIINEGESKDETPN